jgi:hypothetical protein
VQNKLFELGYKWAGTKKGVRYLEAAALFFHVGRADKYITYVTYPNYTPNDPCTTIHLDNLYGMVVHMLKLNNKYTAEVDGEFVKVGCQSFPIDKIIELGEICKTQKQ